MPLWVNMEAEIGKKYRLDIEPLLISGGALGMQALLANSIQMSQNSATAAIGAARCTDCKHAMRIKSGIKLLAETEGTGEPAKKGDTVVYNWRLYRNQGDEIPLNQQQADILPAHLIRVVEGYRFIEHRTTLGRRQTMAGVEYSLYGMKPAGYRKIRVSPHLAYRDQGLGDLIPPKAVLIVEIWLREIIVA